MCSVVRGSCGCVCVCGLVVLGTLGWCTSNLVRSEGGIQHGVRELVCGVIEFVDCVWAASDVVA